MAFTFTDSNVEEIIASGKAVVVDFWAPWCGPCVAMSPVIDALAEEYKDKDIVIGKYNTEEENDFCIANRVISIPQILFFKNGKAAPFRLAGAQKPEKVKETIEKLLAL